ncbi:MAG: ComEC family competence protein [Porphyromonadaceae bacterium]|nr:ComEC family competence protein [Porphyromonadaceae bacterium]
MKRYLFDDAPFLRITVPFAIGIALQEVHPAIFLRASFVLGLIFLILHFYSQHHIEWVFRSRYLFAAATCALCMSAGCASMKISQLEEIPVVKTFSYQYALARLEETPADTGQSVGAKATIIALAAPPKKKAATRIPISLRMEPKEGEHLQAGDLILFQPHFSRITNQKNPEAFDYASLMRHRGYIYTQYLAQDNWLRAGRIKTSSLKNLANRGRDRCLKIIDRGNFSPASQSILKALLLGYTGEIDPEQRAAFSAAGLSHILAVSGLHLGIIWAVLAFLLAPLLWLGLRRLQAALIIVLLWGYVLLTGLSPSAIRACIMASAVLAAILVGRKASPMNGLFMAAFGMLFYNPHYLFQVGFQLSFLSVFSILFFFKPIYDSLPHGNRIVRKILSLLTVSATAQLGTLPLVVYYFHILPLWGLLSNLIIVPLLPVLLGGGFLWLILTGMGINLPFFTLCIDGMANGLDLISRTIESYHWASIRDIWLEPEFLFAWYVLLFGFITSFLYRYTRGIVILTAFAFVCLLADTIGSPRPIRNLCAMYQESRATTLNFVDNGRNWLLPLDTLSSRSTERAAQRFWMKNGIGPYSFISDRTTQGNLQIKLPYIAFQGLRIVVFGDGRWKRRSSHSRMPIDYAIVVPGFKGKIEDIRRCFSVQEVILAHNLSYYQQKNLQEECRALHIPCHRIRTQGAFVAIKGETAVKSQRRDAD